MYPKGVGDQRRGYQYNEQKSWLTNFDQAGQDDMARSTINWGHYDAFLS